MTCLAMLHGPNQSCRRETGRWPTMERATQRRGHQGATVGRSGGTVAMTRSERMEPWNVMRARVLDGLGEGRSTALGTGRTRRETDRRPRAGGRARTGPAARAGRIVDPCLAGWLVGWLAALTAVQRRARHTAHGT